MNIKPAVVFLLWPMAAHATFSTFTDALIPFVGLPLIVWFVVEFLSKAMNTNKWGVFASALAIYALVLVSWTAFSTPPADTRTLYAKRAIGNLSAALDMYRYDHNAYPTTEQGLAVLASGDLGDNRLSRIPEDPWGREYHYRSPGYSGPFDLYTLGADRLPGGEGGSVDVGNWMIGTL